MATRNVQFHFQASQLPSSPTVAATDHMILTVYDNTNAVAFASGSLPSTTTTLTQPLPIQNGYAVRLVSYAADGTPNSGSASGLPFALFNVTAPPPPVAPGDPTIQTVVLL